MFFGARDSAGQALYSDGPWDPGIGITDIPLTKDWRDRKLEQVLA